MRNYSKLDEWLIELDQGLRMLKGKASLPTRSYPATNAENLTLTAAEKKQAAGLMRVNHAGEVCAQALYQGQALTARDASIKQTMQQAASEEIDHLAWCEQRLTELNGRPSYLNPVWYLGSLAIGLAAGIAGDKWSLGFLAETERQVTAHLTAHLQQLPSEDSISRQVVAQMQADEQQHAHTAEAAGAAELPKLLKFGMKLASKIMTRVAYYI